MEEIQCWVKHKHEMYIHYEEMKGLHKQLKKVNSTWGKATPTLVMPKWHWTKGSSSIISPSIISNNMYELMHKGNISRYETLDGAKSYVNNNP